MSVFERRGALPLVAVVYALALVSCGDLPTGQRIDDGPAVRRALSKELGADLELMPTIRLPTGIANQAFSYYGVNGGQIVLVVVFDREQAVRTVLGAGGAAIRTDGTGVIRHRNVVVFYTRRRLSPDLSAQILRSLRRAL